ncbi:MAG: hypothetical protein CMJ58_01905 [Planctomycetaceae bacterium]|nr:hypothetical protein [Planctomycetaceae bacterium]
MELVPGFTALLQPFATTMTAPTFQSFVTLAAGWVLASRRTVTRMILAAGDSAGEHFSSYHRVFSAARWSLDRAGLAVFDLIAPGIEGEVLLAVDDTLARKRGLKMFGCARAPRSAAFQPGQGSRQLGPQLGRAGGDRRVAVPPAALLLPADLVPLVLEQNEGRPAPPRPSHAAGVGRRDARRALFAPRKAAFPRRGRQRLRRAGRAESSADQLRSDQSPADGRAAVRRAAGEKAGNQGPTPQAGRPAACARGDARRTLPTSDVRHLRQVGESPRGRLRCAGPQGAGQSVARRGRGAALRRPPVAGILLDAP